jgi:hypothetical protein
MRPGLAHETGPTGIGTRSRRNTLKETMVRSISGAAWLDTPEYRETLLAPRFSHLGFAERVNGQGRKVALAALGVSP